jgi:ClpP class serine protease
VSSWGELIAALGQVPPEAQGPWLTGRLTSSLQDVVRLRGNRNVMLWGSAFLQKSILPGPFISITGEDLNGFMSVIHGMDCTRGLTLIIHTPGGEIGAAETIVSYLRSKFESIEVVVPAFAMSAGTMISLAAERIVMGRQSQLGPIDPQIGVNGRYVSAGAIVAQYEQAVLDVVGAADRDIKGTNTTAAGLDVTRPGGAAWRSRTWRPARIYRTPF